MKLSLILDAVDRITAPVRRAESSIRQLTNRALKPAERAIESVNRASGGFLGTIPVRIDALRSRIRQLVSGPASMRALERATNAAGNAVLRLGRFAGGLALRGAAIAGAGAGFLGGWLTTGVIGQAAAFEQFQVVLENTEGSAAKARQAMNWVKDFGKTTPYEVGEVMEAFVALKAYGIDPTNGSLRSLGNAASGMGKPLMQAIDMLADAQTGEFERLKEFGIRGSKAGEQVRFTYMRAGKEITRTARANGAEIQRALIGIFDERFSGMMDRQSRTLKGMWSNLQDLFANFQLDVGDAGVFDVVRGKVQQLLDRANALAADGTLKRWAEEISDRMERMIGRASDFVENTDWAQVAADLQDIASAAWDLSNAIAAAVNAAGRLAEGVRNLPQPPKWLGEGQSRLRGWIGAGVPGMGIGGTVAGIVRYELGGKPAAPAAPAPRGPRPPRAPLMPAYPGGWPANRLPTSQKQQIDLRLRLEGNAAPQVSVRGASSPTAKVRATAQRGRAMEGAA